MRSHPTLAGGALVAAAVLTAASGLAGGAAQAAYHRPAHTRAAPAAPVTPDLTVTVSKKAVSLSATTLTPGNTTIDVASGRGSIEVLSLKEGYSIKQTFKDVDKLFGPQNVPYVRKIDKHVTFWGGVTHGGEFAMNLPAGTYYVANLDKSTYATLTVAGTPATRVLPAAEGTVKMVQDMVFHADAKLPNKGWVELKNKASEPHFVDFTKVKKGTSRQQIGTYLMNGAEGQPPWALEEFHEALVVSPDHSFEYYLDASKGEYAELCFWPSRKTGMPHALMGMYDVSKLR